jgi:hypothetical protein
MLITRVHYCIIIIIQVHSNNNAMTTIKVEDPPVHARQRCCQRQTNSQNYIKREREEMHKVQRGMQPSARLLPFN